MNRQETRCTGTKDGKRCSKLISKEASFCSDCESSNTDNVTAQSLCESDIQSTGESDYSESQGDNNGNEKWDVHEQLNTSEASGVSTNVKKRCKNCGHIIHQDQMFCDKCGNKLGVVCLGEIHGKQCSKFISVGSKFCAHCGTANLENNSEKKRAPLKKSCNNCGHVIHKHQKFCNNCGYKIGAPCIGKIKGSPCSAFLNVEIKFCENCGMENPDYIAVQHKVNVQCGGPENVLPPNESVITLTSMGFTREHAIDALKNTEHNVEEAIHRILGIPVYENRRTRRKFNISTTQRVSQNEDQNSYIPSDESIIQLTSMGYTRIEALYALKCCGGRIEKAVDWLLSLPTDEDTMPRTERELYEVNLQGEEQSSVIPSHELVRKLTSVGFTEEQAIGALKCTNGNEEEAVNLLLSSVKDYEMEQMKAAITEDIQTDENVLSEHDGEQDQGDIDIHVENGPSSDMDIQTIENVPSGHEGKEDSGDTKNSIENEATVSNQAQATKVEPTDIKKMLQEKLQKDGLKKTQEFIERILNSHRQNPVRLAVSGRSHVGKSTFINTMRGSKKGDKSFANSGHGNTTMEVTKYPHPENDMIIFYDLPGFGTLSMTKEKFLKQVNISDFDYFFIMFDSVLSEDDAWFVDQIKPYMTPFCLVRTKLDLTLSKDEAVEDTVIQNIRQSHLKSLEDHPDLQKTPLFIISSDQPHIGEMTLLIDYMKNSLSDAKWDAIIYFIPKITESVIQVKYEELCKRIPWAAFEASVISALPIPFLDISLNVLVMKRELQCFIECFQLNSTEAKAVLGVNYRWGINNLYQFIITGLKAVINSGTVPPTIGTSVPSQVDVFVPVIGSAVAGAITFQYVNFFLKRNLDQMKRDADIVFKHTLTKMCEKATSKAVVHDVI